MCEITEDDIVGYMMHGFNRDDEDFIFGSIVREAYLFDDCVLLVFNFRDEVGDLTEIRVALQAQKSANPARGSHCVRVVYRAKSFPNPSAYPAGSASSSATPRRLSLQAAPRRFYHG